MGRMADERERRRRRRKNGPPDIFIFVSTVLLLSIGIVMVYSASSVMALSQYGDSAHFLKKQLIWAILGIGAMIMAMNIDYQTLKGLYIPILVGSILLLGLVLVPGIGTEISGSRRWIDLGIVNFQPSELAKLANVLFLSAYLSGAQDRLRSSLKGLIFPLMVCGLLCGLILLEPDMGTAGVIGAVTLVMLFVGGARILHIGLLIGAAVPLFLKVLFMEEYRVKRFFAFLDPWKDPTGTGYHIIQSLLALGSGGLFGLGLGKSRQKFFYLPEQHTDFIFAILGEELGFMGSFVVIVLFFIIAWRGYKIAISAPDTFGSLLATGITSVIMVQVLINIGVVSGSLPITGITLPFISSGGSSLITTLISVGVLLNISRSTTQRRELTAFVSGDEKKRYQKF
jgi:cell division protein FtsW